MLKVKITIKKYSQTLHVGTCIY